MLITKILYLFRYFFKIKLNKNIVAKKFIFVQKNVKIITEPNSLIVFEGRFVIKENTVIYAKKESRISFGINSSTGHHNEIVANKKIDIGNNVIMGAYVYIADSNHGFNNPDRLILQHPMDVGTVSIGSNVWIGRGAYVLKDAKVSDDSVVAAASVVTKEFPNKSVLGGVPAKRIKGIYE